MSRSPSPRRFLFLLSVLAALLAVCLLVIAKSFVEHAAFRNVLGTMSFALLVPVLWLTSATLVRAAFGAGLGAIEIHAPTWVYKLTLALIFLVAAPSLANEFFDIPWLG
jgi:hypothetical protein